jgi:hypothetical protein
MGPAPKCHFVPGLPNGSPEISKVGTPVTLGAHNFVCGPSIEMRFKEKLEPSLRAFQRYVARHLHATKLGRFLTFTVESQIANLTPDLSFGHNLCFKCPNGSCEPILASKFQKLFNDINKSSIQYVLTPAIAL